MPPILRAATSCSPWLCRQTADCFQFVAQSAVQSICQRHHECQGLVPTHSRFWGWAPATVPGPPSLYSCLWALERLSQGLFLHNLGLLIPQSSFKWRRAEKKLVNTGSHRTVPCIRLEPVFEPAHSTGNFMKLLLRSAPAPPAHPWPCAQS